MRGTLPVHLHCGYRGYLGVPEHAIVTLFPIFSYPLVSRVVATFPASIPMTIVAGDLLARRHRLVGTLGNLPLAVASPTRQRPPAAISNALFIDTNSRPSGRNTS